MYKDVTLFPYQSSIVYVKKFLDLEDFLLQIKDKEINPIFNTRMSSEFGSYQFTQTKSYEEAWDLCRYTMDEGFDNFYKKFAKLSYKVDELEQKENKYSVTGFSPSVPRFLLGIPFNMKSYGITNKPQKINIYMNLGYSAFQGKEEIEARGIIILNLMRFFENINIKVALYTYDFSQENTEKSLILIPLKTVNEKINVKKLYFPLVHPSFLRRLIFRAQEKMPYRDSGWSHGYGYPVLYEAAINFFKTYKEYFEKEKTIYISTPSEMNIHGNNLEEDFESFIKVLNSKYGEVLERKL